MSYKIPIKFIISGGQTGVDTAALVFAIENQIPHMGYCPLGRRNENGKIPSNYNLIETDSEDYSGRTRRNVEISDGTLILYLHIIRSGTNYTLCYCEKIKKPVITISLGDNLEESFHRINLWITEQNINTLNIAGPRESEGPVFKSAHLFLQKWWQNYLTYIK